MRSHLALAFLLLLLAPLVVAVGAPSSTILLPREGEPDVPSATPPIWVSTAFENDVWSFTETVRTGFVTVPDVRWNRAVLTLTVEPGTDPWDRLFGVAIDGVEVLHGATVRAPMTVERDVTAYASRLPSGESVPVQLKFGTWVGYQLLTVRIAFYDDASAALVPKAHDEVVAPFLFAGLGGDGSRVSATAAFPAAPATSGVMELTVSGHGGEGEFWYQYGNSTPPTFVILADGVEIGRATAMPYVYALLGFSPMSPVTRAVHTGMWWTAQRALDVAGIHTGTAEIPAYVADIPPETLARLTGDVVVEVVVEGGQGGYWPASLSFLLD